MPGGQRRQGGIAIAFRCEYLPAARELFAAGFSAVCNVRRGRAD
ncbi:hypothetical protein HMPREF1986_02441 [Oribacterium sp. oral taxon 078 str. F0263]|nr:hypothetical protein HMPREF1986_02441 [Oribacterium sp. oral taxon 078 str. F0263]